MATVKLLCLAISSPRSQVNERRRDAGSLTNVPAQRGDDRRRVFAGHFDQHDETRMTFHQGCDVTVLAAAEQIALPMTGDGAVFDLRGPFPDGDGIDDLTAGVSAVTRSAASDGYAAWTADAAISSFFSTPRAWMNRLR